MKVVKLLLLCSLPILLWSCATTPTGTQTSQTAEKRVALVIGNNNYSNLEKKHQLKQAVQDAQDMRDKLRKLGFKVFYGENLSLSDMKKQLNNFTSEIDKDTLSFVYYSGHGASDPKGLNYLIPSDFDGTKGLAVDEIVFQHMKEKKSAKNILALDMCRSNGVSIGGNTKGLAKGDIAINSPYNPDQKHDTDGVFIGYSTDPNNYSYEDYSLGNSRYTHFLLQHIDDKTLSVSELFGRVTTEVMEASKKASEGKSKDEKEIQSPWNNSSLKGDDIFLAKMPMSSEMGSRP